MNVEELAHVLRAAAEIAGDPGIVVIGSQAILASIPDTALPDEAVRSVEADICFFDDPEAAKADAVDGAIGEASMFHQTHGYYGQGVELSSAVLPAGWRDRLVPFARIDAHPACAYCLEPYDIAVAKLVAGRDKDYEYVGALLDAGVFGVKELRARCELLPGVPALRRRVLGWIDRDERRRARRADSPT